MSTRSLSGAVFCSLLLLSSEAASGPLPDESAAATPAGSSAKQRNDKKVEFIDDVDEYIERTRDVVARAADGDYGRIKKRDMKRVLEAQQSIEDLLANRKGEVTLTHDEQIQLANAQESMNAIIRADDKSRMICKRVAGIGTRIPKTECLSVARREQLAEIARQVVKTANDYCVPGEGNRCGK